MTSLFHFLMTKTYEIDWELILTNWLPFLSILISCGAFVFTIYRTRKARKISQGNTEINISRIISDSRNQIINFKIELHKIRLQYPDKDHKSLLVAFKSILENQFNQYEKACSLYLDNKIDKKRFKEDYQKDLFRIVQSKNNTEYFDRKKNRFPSLIKVYDEWKL